MTPKVDNTVAAGLPGDTPAEIARALVRRAWKAALGTLDRTTGHPYTSLVAMATEPDGTPLMLLSRLALHTKNLDRDSRASVLIDGTGAAGDVLAGERITLIGSASVTSSKNARLRFLARHPSAATYADFADFSFYRLQIERAHFIGGFGRIVELKPHDLVAPAAGAEALIEAETEIREHINEDHAGTLELIATRLGNAQTGRWRLVGLDPDGLDLALGDCALRLLFGRRAHTPEEARDAIVALAGMARQAAGEPP